MKKTIEELVKSAGRDITIEVRLLGMLQGEKSDDLFGYCRYDCKTSTLVPLDRDSYYLDEKVVKWEWHENGDLTVWEEAEYLSAKEFDALLERMKKDRERLSK